jgi:hypothetical protein
MKSNLPLHPNSTTSALDQVQLHGAQTVSLLDRGCIS